jgi:DNA-binding NarL/FixJ family response regulator
VELTLPDMSGFQVLTRLNPRAFKQEIPVILFSRLDLPSIKRLAINNGAQTYLLKSDLGGHELAWAIRKAISAVALRKESRS